MKKKSTLTPTTTALRLRAETRLQGDQAKRRAAGGTARSPVAERRLVHELEVHQIELQMQNEELQLARDEMAVGFEKYSDLYDFAPIGFLTLDRAGTIRESNLAAASMLGLPRSLLLKKLLGEYVDAADRLNFRKFLQHVFERKVRQECDVRLRGKDQPPLNVRLRANCFASGEVCRIAVSDITQHKLAAETSARLAAIVNSSHDAIVGIDLKGIVTSWNAGAERLFGYSSAEIVGCPITLLIPPERMDEENEIMSRIRRGERVEPIETVRVARDGRRFDMSVAISPICQADGKITGASKMARDITAHKQAENRVRASEIRYRRLFEATHDGVLLLDPATCKITDANPFMTKLLGYPREQLIGKELFEIGLLKDETASQEMFQKLTKQHEVRYEDLPLESQTGRHQEVEVVANLYEENGLAVIQCNIRDITARKLAEDALRRSEERYRSLFDSIDEGFCVIELLFDAQARPVDYRFLEVNPAFEHQSGIRGGLGKRMLEIVDKIDPYWLEMYGQVVATGTPFRGSSEATALDRWFDVYAFQLGGRQSRQVALLFSDITERKKIEQALCETRARVATYAGKLEKLVTMRTAQLTATNRRLSASVDANRRAKEEYRALFLAAEEMQKKFRQLTRQVLTAQEDERRHISRELHDVVVQTLVGINVELAALGRVAGAGARPLQAKIGRTQRLVEKSVHAVHQFARELRPAVLDDLGLVPALQSFMKTIAARENMQLHLTAFAGVEALDNDRRTVLYRVAQEALTNVVRHAEASRVEVHIAEVSGAVRMEVRDNGKSFDVARAMSPKTNKRLGLLGMRERIEMLGGAVTIESVAGQGSTVRAELPFQKSLAS